MRPCPVTTGSSECIWRLGAALRTREERLNVSDPTERPWHRSQAAPQLLISLRLALQATLLLALLAALPGCALMACSRTRGEGHPEGRPEGHPKGHPHNVPRRRAHAGGCANGCGVLLSGCAWVGTCGCSAALLLLGTLLLLLGVAAHDAAAVFRAVADPATLVGAERCARYYQHGHFYWPSCWRH